MKLIDFEAEIRKRKGKGASRSLRREGKVPAILYGKDMEPLLLTVLSKELSDLEHEQGIAGALLKLKVDGKPYTAVVKEVARDPLTDEYLHVDFQKISMTEKISTFVPIVVKGEEACPGIKLGGVLQHGINEVEIEALPRDIPEHLEVDISTLEIGDNIRVGDLTPPSGVEIISDENEIVLTILPPTMYEEEVEEVAGEVAEEAVGEKEVAAEEAPPFEEEKEEGS